MAVAVSAVVGGDDKEGVLQDAQLLVGLVELTDHAVLLGDLGVLGRGVVAAAVARAVGLVQLNEQEGGLLPLDVGNGFADDGGIPHAALLVHVKAVLHDTHVDGIPVADRAQFGVGHLLADDAEHAGEAGIGGVGGVLHDGVGQPVPLGGNAVEHTAPALGADGRIGGQHLVGHRPLLDDLVQIGGVGVLEEGTRAVHADDHHVLIDVALGNRLVGGVGGILGGSLGGCFSGSFGRCLGGGLSGDLLGGCLGSPAVGIGGGGVSLGGRGGVLGGLISVTADKGRADGHKHQKSQHNG